MTLTITAIDGHVAPIELNFCYQLMMGTVGSFIIMGGVNLEVIHPGGGGGGVAVYGLGLIGTCHIHYNQVIKSSMPTVPTFNSCTQWVGSPGMPDCHQVPWSWRYGSGTSQLKAALTRKLRWSLMCLAYFWRVIHRSLYNQEQADVRTTGAGTKCLYRRAFLYKCHLDRRITKKSWMKF